MDRNAIIVAVLVVLVLITAVQAIQLNTLKNNIGSGLTSGSAAQNTPVSSGGGASGGSDGLPEAMVGGC